MNLWHLIVRELSHRLLNFGLGLLAVAASVACLVGTLTLLKADQLRTTTLLNTERQKVEEVVALREQEVADTGAELKDAMRVITKGLGFNILVLPQDQDLNELQVEGTLSETMPEEYVDRLAESDIVTINHLLPIVTTKLEWAELDRTVILTGTRGEVPFMHRPLKKPLLDLVPEGSMVVGYNLHAPDKSNRRKLKLGEEITLLGRTFMVTELLEQRGSADDSTIWINLGEAQELLGKQNLLNAILALECNCATVDRVGEIRAEIGTILPGTQIIERGAPALARAEARNTAAAVAEATLKREQEAGVARLEQLQASRSQLEQSRATFGSILLPIVLVASGVIVGLLSYGNVRQRRPEIGILRAIGLSSTQVFVIVLGKAILIGLAGAAVGLGIGIAVGAAWEPLPADYSIAEVIDPTLLMVTLVAAPFLASLASWIPALLAARQDPALVLQDA